MANYSLVINSQFKPFSYQEMLAPVLMATQTHQELENQYGELATKANVWEEMANEQTDPYAYKMYKTYANDLENQARQLAREGLNAASRRNALNMRARYSREITPIETAYRRRDELAAEQRRASLSNPTMFYQRNASTMSLDDFIRNPSMDYGEKYSGALLSQQVGQMAANLKTALTGKGKLKGIGLPYQYEQLLQYGYTPEQIQQAITNPQKGDPVLNTIIEQALTASGMKDWASPEQLAQARAYANQGLYNAIGKTEFKNFTDSFSMQDALNARQHARQVAARRAELEQARSNSLAINPLNIYSSRELNDEERRYNDNIKNFSKYFYKDAKGRIKMNEAGLQEYKRVIKGTSGDPLVTPEGTVILTNVKETSSPTSFRRFIDSLGGNRYIGYGKDSKMTNWQPGNVGNLWANYVSNSPAAKTARYDATKVTEYDYYIDDSQQASMKDAILTANRGLTLKEVDYDSKSKTFKDTGEEITMSDLASNKYRVTNTRFSPYGNTVMIQDDEGNVRRFRMPSGINTTNEHNRDRIMQKAYLMQNIVNTGKYTDGKGNIRDATSEEIAYAQQLYTQALQQAYLFHSQIGMQNKTKEQEFSPYGY